MVLLHPAYLYNPGLEPTWFIVTGILGVLLILNGSLISAAAIVKEREAGTLEQLLMSPASTTQIIVAKLFPLFVLLCMMGTMAVVIMRVVFGIPFRGNVLLVIAAAALCLLCGISIGTFIATFTKSARQAQLTLFFVNPPLTSLSGAFTPVEAMPKWLQPVAQFNPIQHFGDDLARRDVEGKRDRHAMAQFPRAFGVHRRARFVEHLAIQKTTQLGPAQGSLMCR